MVFDLNNSKNIFFNISSFLAFKISKNTFLPASTHDSEEGWDNIFLSRQDIGEEKSNWKDSNLQPTVQHGPVILEK